jgi:hypothetical protein
VDKLVRDTPPCVRRVFHEVIERILQVADDVLVNRISKDVVCKGSDTLTKVTADTIAHGFEVTRALSVKGSMLWESLFVIGLSQDRVCRGQVDEQSLILPDDIVRKHRLSQTLPRLSVRQFDQKQTQGKYGRFHDLWPPQMSPWSSLISAELKNLAHKRFVDHVAIMTLDEEDISTCPVRFQPICAVQV